VKIYSKQGNPIGMKEWTGSSCLVLGLSLISVIGGGETSGGKKETSEVSTRMMKSVSEAFRSRNENRISVESTPRGGGKRFRRRNSARKQGGGPATARPHPGIREGSDHQAKTGDGNIYKGERGGEKLRRGNLKTKAFHPARWQR